MRPLKLISAIALFGLSLLSGCSSSSSSSPSPAYSMTATIGSAHLNAATCIAALVSTTMGISGSTVTSGAGGPPQINISIANWTGTTGTFPISTTSSGTFAEYVSATGAITLTSQTGSVTISSISSTTIAGTFNFTCTDGTTVVTSGVFTAKNL